MKKKLVTGLGIGGAWGLLFGLQQSIPVLLSSWHDLPVFPKTSFLAMVVILFLYGVFFALVAGLGTFLVQGKNDRLRERRTWVLALGMGAAAVVMVFLFGRFRGIINKWTVKAAIVLAGGLFFLIVSAFVYPMMIFLERKKRIFKWVKIALSGGVFAFLTLLLVVILVAKLITIRYGFAGLPKGNKMAISKGSGSKIILVTIDALRADRLGVYGYPGGVSSNLDGLAKEGVIFERAYANAPWTFPSLSSMLASRMPTELGISVNNLLLDEIENGDFLPARAETLPERMQSLGYKTQAILTNGWLTEARGFAQGFDGFLNLEKLLPYHYNFHFKDLSLVTFLSQNKLLGKAIEDFYTSLVSPASPKQLETPASELNRWAFEWLENNKDEQFFLWMHYIDPHAPYGPQTRFSPDLSELVDSGREMVLRGSCANPGDADRIRWREVDRQATMALYDGDVAQADQAVGELWQKLQELGIEEETILVVTADHGEEFWEHGGMGHGRTFYEETVRVPLLMVGPGIEPRRVGTNVSLLDIYPTLVDLAGGKRPVFARGRSLVNWLTGGSEEAEEIFIEAVGWGTERKALVSGDYKLIHDFFTGTNQLFDLSIDRGEIYNLAPNYGQFAQNLQAGLEKQRLIWEDGAKEILGGETAAGLGGVVGY